MSIYFQDDTITLHHGKALDVARTLESGSVDCIVTSPPYYGLRDYGNDGQYGLEETPAAYVDTMRALFSELRRVLSDDGTLWLNIGDSYSGSANSGGRSARRVDSRGVESGDSYRISGLPTKKGPVPKNLLGMPWRTAFALQDDGWILRNAIIWHKPNAMPESVTDRLSTRYEQFFMFSKSQRYHFDLDPIREELIRPEAVKEGIVFGGKNKGSAHRTGPGNAARRDGNVYGGKYDAEDKAPPVDGKRHTAVHPKGKNPGDMWSVNTQPFGGAHFAVMPQELARRAIVAGCKPGGTVLDPFSGSGTTGLVAQNNGRKYVGIDLSADYLKLSIETRLRNATLDLEGTA